MNKQELTNIFIKKIEQERMKRGWKQYELAEKLDMSLPGYRKMISGQTDSIYLYTVVQAAKIFEMPISAMFCQSDKLDVIEKICSASESVCHRINHYLDVENRLQEAYDKLDIQETMIDVLVPSCYLKDGVQINSYLIEKKAIKNIYDEEIHKGFRMNENTFLPTYAKGDILLINEEPARNGDITLLLNSKTQRFFIRKLLIMGYYECHPVNGCGGIFRIPEDERTEWIDCGHVVSVLHQ